METLACTGLTLTDSKFDFTLDVTSEYQGGDPERILMCTRGRFDFHRMSVAAPDI